MRKHITLDSIDCEWLEIGDNANEGKCGLGIYAEVTTDDCVRCHHLRTYNRDNARREDRRRGKLL